MHSKFLATLFIAMSVANDIFAVPLSLAHAEPTTDEEKANLASLQEANTEVNNQIPHMEQVFKDPDNEKHKPLIEAAFGKEVDLKTAPGGGTIAYTKYDNQRASKQPTSKASGHTEKAEPKIVLGKRAGAPKKGRRDLEFESGFDM